MDSEDSSNHQREKSEDDDKNLTNKLFVSNIDGKVKML